MATAAAVSVPLAFSSLVNFGAGVMYSFLWDKNPPQPLAVALRTRGLGNLILCFAASEIYAARRGASLELRRVLATVALTMDIAIFARFVWVHLNEPTLDDPVYKLFSFGTVVLGAEVAATSYCIWSTLKEEGKKKTQ